MQRFLPHVTVATVIEKDGKFLLVKEQQNNCLVYNQPAGHIESGESLGQAAVRECKEETAWEIELTGFLGVTVFYAKSNGITYIRNTFVGKALKHDPKQPLDTGIQGIEWLTLQEIDAYAERLRSPLVLDAISRYCQGEVLPMTAVNSFGLEHSDGTL